MIAEKGIKVFQIVILPVKLAFTHFVSWIKQAVLSSDMWTCNYAWAKSVDFTMDICLACKSLVAAAKDESF